MNTNISSYSEARQAGFRRRVLQARLHRLEEEITILLGDIALLECLGLPDAAEMIEVRLETLTREALRHRRALEDRTPLAEVVSPRIAWAS